MVNGSSMAVASLNLSLDDRDIDALKDIPADKLDLECSEVDLFQISQSFTKWLDVSPYLGLTEADEEEIRDGRDVKRQRIDALKRWKGRQKSRGTYRSLIETFYRAQRLDLVDVAITVLLTSTTTLCPPTPAHIMLPTDQSPSRTDQSVHYAHPFSPPTTIPYTYPFPPCTNPFPSRIDSFPPHVDPFPPCTGRFPSRADSFQLCSDPFPTSTDPFPLHSAMFSPRMEQLVSPTNFSPPTDQQQSPNGNSPASIHHSPQGTTQQFRQTAADHAPPPLHRFPPSLQLSTFFTLLEYGEYLKRRYRKDIPIFSRHWPPMPIQKAFNLAMIRQTKIQRGEVIDKFVRMTITGKVDDILHIKTPVKLEDIFMSIPEDKRKVFLIEGAPGSGKSALSWDICRRWGAGELFQEFDVVILVQLRDPKVQSATTLADLLPAKSDAMAESAASQIIACEGSKVLFVLDGWDELPPHLQSTSLYHQLIKPEEKTDLCLLESAVIVTSRPISSGDLHPLVSSRVEIVGFSPAELKQYFSECLSKCLIDDSQAVDRLLEGIEENPVVASSCYLPLNAAIIVHVFLSRNQKLPTTVNGILTALVLCSFYRYQTERLGLKGEAANLESLDTLPKKLRKPFRKLCALAFWGVMEDKVTFTKNHLENQGIHTDVSGLDLLQAVPSLVSQKVPVYYSFLHLLFQELLAAYHISTLPASEQITRFQQLFQLPRFATVFHFYAAITRFQSERKYLSKLAMFLPIRRFVPIGILDVITNMIQRHDPQLLISVIGCLFEASDSSLCQFVARQLNWQLLLSYCDVGNEGVRLLGEALLTNDSLKSLILFGNRNISVSSLSVLTECLKKNRGLVELYFPDHCTSALHVLADVQEAINATRRAKSIPLIRVRDPSECVKSLLRESGLL